MAVASAGPYANLHLDPDTKPCQHPTTQFFTSGRPFLPLNQQHQSTEGTTNHFLPLWMTYIWRVTELWDLLQVTNGNRHQIWLQKIISYHLQLHQMLITGHTNDGTVIFHIYWWISRLEKCIGTRTCPIPTNPVARVSISNHHIGLAPSPTSCVPLLCSKYFQIMLFPLHLVNVMQSFTLTNFWTSLLLILHRKVHLQVVTCNYISMSLNVFKLLLQLFYGPRDFVRDYPGEPVPER